LSNTQPSNGTDTQGREGINHRVRRTSRRVVVAGRSGAEAIMRAVADLSAGLAPRALVTAPARVENSGYRYPPSAPSSGRAASPSAASCVGGRAVPLPPTCCSHWPG